MAVSEARARKLLHDALGRIDVQAEGLARDRADGAAADEVGGMDSGDRGARATAHRDGELADSTLRVERSRIVHALERLDVGTYGRCVVCDRPIDEERLMARPEADRCRDHAGPS